MKYCPYFSMVFTGACFCFFVIHLSFCLLDTAIKSIIQSPHVAKVHLLPAKSSTPTWPQRKPREDQH